MSNEVKPDQDACQTVTPHLVVKGASEALAFYAEAFGAKELMRMPGPDGKLWHAAIAIGKGQVMLADEFPESPCKSPKSLGGSPVTIHVKVDDVDATFARAVAAGAEPAMPPMDMFWGDRYSQVVDPFGHRWSLATPIESLTTEQMAERGAAMMAKMESCGEVPEPVPA